jgi:hypothetical protein
MASDYADNLLNVLLPFAKQTLQKYGEFFPFGAKVTTNGETVQVAGATDSERPPSQELIDMLIAGFLQEGANGEILASGICYDSRFRIQVTLMRQTRYVVCSRVVMEKR